jgi:uncharacterized protein (TIGR00251 family)
MKIIETREGVVIQVFVKPRSKKFKVSIEGDYLVVHSTEEPVEGKVNKELVKEFSRFFKKKVELIYGSRSREKKLLISEAKKDKVEEALRSFLTK